MSLTNALENETANEAFWVHKLYALPEALLFKMPIKKKNKKKLICQPPAEVLSNIFP